MEATTKVDTAVADTVVSQLLTPFVCAGITQEDHKKVSQWTTEMQMRHLQQHGMYLSKTQYKFSTYRYITDAMMLFEEFPEIERTQVGEFAIQLYADEGNIVANIMSRDDINSYLAECEKACNITAWMVVMSPDILAEYSVAPLHACVVIFNHLTRKIYYMDSNATHSYLGDGEMTQYIDAMLSTYFADTGYEYVWACAWRPPRSIQRFPGRKDWDRGNCLILSIMLVHILILGDYIDPQQAYVDMLELTADVVYGYITYMRHGDKKRVV